MKLRIKVTTFQSGAVSYQPQRQFLGIWRDISVPYARLDKARLELKEYAAQFDNSTPLATHIIPYDRCLG